MIVTLDAQLFLPEHADDSLLHSILWYGMQGRFGVRTRPAFRRDQDHLAQRWLETQSPSAANTAHQALVRGLTWKAYAHSGGRREPEVILEPGDEEPQWPRSFDEGPVRLSLSPIARALLERPLHLLLESRRNDGAFLRKTVPPAWRKRWRRAIERGWLEPEHGGGLTEIREILRDEIAGDEIRRLRSWVMFDSDATARDRPSEASQRTAETCRELCVPFHQLERRMIENYIPPASLRQWARDAARAVREGSNREKHLQAVKALEKAVEEHCKRPPEQKHYESLKQKPFIPPRKFGYSAPVDVWAMNAYEISEPDLIEDGWDDERQALFSSLMASL